MSWCVFALAMLDREPDMRKEPPWRQLLPRATLVIGALALVYAELPPLWPRIADRLAGSSSYVWHWNEWMRSIPGNDASFLWSHRAPGLTYLFKHVYLDSFNLMAWIGILRATFCRDLRKAMRFALATHVLQFALIFPFYRTIALDEVWFVLGHPDGCGRTWPQDVQRLMVGNCFPSMHTSIAVAVLLLGRREKSRLARGVLSAYTLCVVASTLYLEVHWVLDVLAGICLGMVAVWLTDRVLPARSHAPSRG